MKPEKDIEKIREGYPFVIDAWVLLLDHLHCIWTLPPGDANLGIRWAMIKRHVSKHCQRLKHDNWLNESKRKRNESTVWQRRFWEHQIRDDKDFVRHVDHIHYNPVKHGLAQAPRDWQYSSFHRYVRDGTYDVEWGAKRDITFDAAVGNE